MTFTKLRLATFAAVLMGLQPFLSCAEKVPSNIRNVVHQYFEGVSEDEIEISPLFGGHSSLNFRVDAASKQYVLRFNERSSAMQFQCELFALQEASKIGISPFVFQAFPDEKMVLMEYVDGNTLTIEQASQEEICVAIAKNLQKAHAITKNPYHGPLRCDVMEGFYAQLSDVPQIQKETALAIEIIRKCHHEIITSPSSYSVNTHNDLNPGNILTAKDKVYFIDWEGTNYEDPFYDLSYFSIFHDYNEDMERLLLNSYLDRAPTSEELNRYRLTKKVNFARISLSCYIIAFVQNKPDVSDKIHPDNWSHYAKSFADKCFDDLSVSQLFYNLARASLQEANL